MLPMKVTVPLLSLFVILAVLSARTNLPWSDEAWFASPALQLITNGSFGTPVLDETASFRNNNLTGIHSHTYWIVPLYPLAEAAWFEVTGFSLAHVRYFSILWGLVAMLVWYRLMRLLSGDVRVARLALLLMAADFTVIWSASVGRMDMMTAALGGAGLLSYLLLRETKLSRAVLVSQTLIVAAGLTHPMALGYGAALVAVTLYRDMRRIRWRHIGLALIPYLFGAAGWAIYIAQAPRDFLLQFGGNAAQRGLPLNHPLEILHSQLVVRYLYVFGFAPDTHGFSRSKVLILAVYVAGVLGVLLNRQLRSETGYRTLILISGVTLFTMMAIDREAQRFYLIHFVLWMISFTAVSVVWWWDRRTISRYALMGAIALVLMIQLATTGRRIVQNGYSTVYLPVASYLQSHAHAKDTIMGSSELAFQLGYVDNLVDDQRLGFRSGRHPDFIVIDKNRYAEWIPQYEHREPATWRYIRGMMDGEFHPVLSNEGYQVYARNGM
jgi:hypothetical protein